MATPLSPLAQSLVKAFQLPQSIKDAHGGIKVNPIISEVAFWYEKVRNAMDYHEEEVVLRAAIERILRRRLIFGGSGKSVAAPLLRELIWARYFPDEGLSEDMIEQVATTIDLYAHLRQAVLSKKQLPDAAVETWFYQLASAHVATILSPNQKKEVMVNFVYHVLRNTMTITDDNEATRNVQVFLAVRRTFGKEDLAFLRFRLFKQVFGDFNASTIQQISDRFVAGYQEIERQLAYPVRSRVNAIVKRQIPPFLILEDILLSEEGDLTTLLSDQEKLHTIIEEDCQKRYRGIAAKVRRAIFRSLIFILLTKVIVGFGIEGTFDTLVYGRIAWDALLINIAMPPAFLLIASTFIVAPGKENTQRIIERIDSLLYSENPKLGATIQLRKDRKKMTTISDITFSILWFAAFVVSFGTVFSILTLLHFNPASQVVFAFFFAVIAFLIYRIHQMAKAYTVITRQNFFTPIIDFFFMPIAQVGRRITEGVAQVNIFLFLLDFLIEAPFKQMFGFLEQLFFFLHTKREYLE